VVADCQTGQLGNILLHQTHLVLYPQPGEECLAEDPSKWNWDMVKTAGAKLGTDWVFIQGDEEDAQLKHQLPGEAELLRI
jgi:hypothetical protein